MLLCLTLCDPMDCSPPGFSVHGILQARYWIGLPCPPPEDLPNPGIKPRSLALQANTLLSEPRGKPMNPGVDSLSLPPQDLPDPGINPQSPALQADSLPAELLGKPLLRSVGLYFHQTWEIL